MAPILNSTLPRRASPARKLVSSAAARSGLSAALSSAQRRAVSYSTLLTKQQRRRQRIGIAFSDQQSGDETGEWTSEDDGEGSRGDDEGGSQAADDEEQEDEEIVSLAKSKKLMKSKVRFVSDPLPRPRQVFPRERQRTTSSSSASSSPRAIAKLYSPARLATRSFVISKALSPNSAPFVPQRVSASRAHVDTPTPSPSQSVPSSSDAASRHFQVTPSPALTDISTFSSSHSTLTTPQTAQEGFDASIDSISFVYEPASISEKFLRNFPSTSPESLAALSPLAKPFPPPTMRIGSFGRRIEYDPAEISFAPVEEEDESVFASDGEEEARKASEVYHAEVDALRHGPITDVERASGEMARLNSSPLSKKRKPATGVQELRGKRIPVMVGPESLPYARNPSGVDGSVVDEDGRLNIWRPSPNDPEPEHVDRLHFQRRPGGGGNPRSSADGPPSNDTGYAHPSVYAVPLVHRSTSTYGQRDRPFRTYEHAPSRSSFTPIPSPGPIPSYTSSQVNAPLVPTAQRSMHGRALDYDPEEHYSSRLPLHQHPTPNIQPPSRSLLPSPSTLPQQLHHTSSQPYVPQRVLENVQQPLSNFDPQVNFRQQPNAPPLQHLSFQHLLSQIDPELLSDPYFIDLLAQHVMKQSSTFEVPLGQSQELFSNPLLPYQQVIQPGHQHLESLLDLEPRTVPQQQPTTRRTVSFARSPLPPVARDVLPRHVSGPARSPVVPSFTVNPGSSPTLLQSDPPHQMLAQVQHLRNSTAPPIEHSALEQAILARASGVLDQRSISSSYPIGLSSTSSSLELPSHRTPIENDPVFLPAGTAPGFVHSRRPGPKAPLSERLKMAAAPMTFRMTVKGMVEEKPVATVGKGKAAEAGSWRREKIERIQRERGKEESAKAQAELNEDKGKIRQSTREQQGEPRERNVSNAFPFEAAAPAGPTLAEPGSSEPGSSDKEYLTLGSLSSMFGASSKRSVQEDKSGLPVYVPTSKSSGGTKSRSSAHPKRSNTTPSSRPDRPTVSASLPLKPILAEASSSTGPATPSSSSSQSQSTRNDPRRGQSTANKAKR